MTMKDCSVSPKLNFFSCADMYVKDIQSGICAKEGTPTIDKETVATALVNGRNLLGPVVGNFCMDLAIQKARDAGIGWVVAYGKSTYEAVAPQDNIYRKDSNNHIH